MAQLTVLGIESLTRKLNNISNMDIKKAVDKATLLVHGQAVELAVFEKGYSKGNLRESIHFNVKKVPNGIQGRVYTNVEYAPYVEFGTGVRGTGSYPYDIEGINLAYHESWAGMEAQPYMYPALNMHKKHIEKLLKNAVKDELRENCKGGN